MDIYTGLAHPGQELRSKACDTGEGRLDEADVKIQTRCLGVKDPTLRLLDTLCGWACLSLHSCGCPSHFLLCWPNKHCWGNPHPQRGRADSQAPSCYPPLNHSLEQGRITPDFQDS